MLSLFKRFISFITTILIAFGMMTHPVKMDPIKASQPEEIQMQVALMSDPQFIANDKGEFAFRSSVEDVNNNKNALDGLVVAGDFTEAGDDVTNEIFMDIMKDVKVENKILALGNHDVLLSYSHAISRFINDVNNLKCADYTVSKPYYYSVINGYYFIVLGPEKQKLEDVYMTQEQLDFLDEMLAVATQEGKPAFVFCHQPVSYTYTNVQNPETGKSEKQHYIVTEIMKKYENVFYIFGHTHTGFGQNTYLEADGVPVINIPANGKKSSRGYNERGTGFVMEVYSDRVVFRSRNFAQGFYLGQDNPEFDRTYYLSK